LLAALPLNQALLRRSLARTALHCVLITLAWTDIFMLSDRFPLAVYAAFAAAAGLCGMLIASDNSCEERLQLADPVYYITLLVLIVLIGIAFLNGRMSAHSLDYAIWFSWIVGVYGIVSKLLVDIAAPDEGTLRVLRVSIALVCVMGVYEWLAINSLIGVPPMLDQLGRRGETYFAALLGNIRLRSTTSEAAHFAMFLNILVPLSLLSVRKLTRPLLLYGLIVLIAYVLTMSLSAWGCLFVAVAFGTVISGRGIGPRILVVGVAIGVGALALYVGSGTSEYADLFGRIADPQDPSRVDRLTVWRTAADSILADRDSASVLFGTGPASFIDQFGTNPISWYLLFAHDLGLLSVVVLVLVEAYVWRSILLSERSPAEKILLQTSLLAATLQYAVNADFWHPWIWVANALALFFSRSRNDGPLVSGARASS
jgi:O-antigen ligase